MNTKNTNIIVAIITSVFLGAVFCGIGYVFSGMIVGGGAYSVCYAVIFGAIGGGVVGTILGWISDRVCR